MMSLLPIVLAPVANVSDIDDNVSAPYSNSFEDIFPSLCLDSFQISGEVGYVILPQLGQLITKIYISLVEGETNEIFINNQLIAEGGQEVTPYSFTFVFGTPRKVSLAYSIQVTIEEVI